MIIRFIGDVHGRFKPYRNLIRFVPVSMQVGDMGVGFISRRTYKLQVNPPHYAMIKADHKFIRGNHDNPLVARNMKTCIPDGTMHNNVFCVGGGLSIDRHLRYEGFDYWPDEQLSYSEFQRVIDDYDRIRPDYVVSHDCPETIADICKAHNRTKFDDPSITRQALEAMLDIHRPKLWVFGHWHRSMDIEYQGTRFICLAELEYKDIDIPQ